MASRPTTATPSGLERHRALVEPIDEQIAELLARRLAVCRESEAEHWPEVLDRCTSLAERHSLRPGLVRGVFDALTREAGNSEGSLLGRMSTRIDHVAIAVTDLEAAIETYRTTLGFELVERRRVEGTVSGMFLAEMKAGAITFVLVQGDSPESNVTRYIERYGPGVQHVALEVDDVPALLADLRERGCELLTDAIQSPGLQQAFTGREPNTGMQLEFIGRGAEQGFVQGNIEELFQAMERENAY